MYDYILVLFSPGFGGNHLTNMISLSTGYDKSRLPDNIDDLFATYNQSLKLHGSLANMQDAFVVKKLKQKPPLMLCGHLGEYLKAYKYFSRCKNKKFVILSCDDYWRDDLEKIRYRLDQLGYVWHHDEWFGWEQSFLYRVEHLHKVLDTTPDELVYVNLRDFLQNDIKPVLQHVANKLNLSIDNLDTCQKLHDIWLKNNKIGL